MLRFYDLAVIDNVPFGLTGSQGRFFALRLERPDWKSWAPGQFVMLRPQGWALDMPWARPFSICRVSTNELVIFFQVAGRGTEKMAKLRRGDKVHLWGPLGNRFAVEGGTPTLLLAGGIGIAPFVGYAERHPTPGVLSMVFGHRLPEDCYPVESLGERIDVESFHENTSEDLEWFLTMSARASKPMPNATASCSPAARPRSSRRCRDSLWRPRRAASFLWKAAWLAV